MTVKYFANKITGLSTDAKPSQAPDGSVFYTTDTNVFYDKISGTWTERDRITAAQTSAIAANTAKTGITTGTLDAITANTAKVSLTDNSVTLAKLAHGTAGKILGFNSSTGVPEEQDAPSSGAGSVLVDHDGTIGNYTQAIGSVSASSQFPIVSSSFSSTDFVTASGWNLTKTQLNGNSEQLNSTYKVVYERDLRTDGASVYLTDYTFKYGKYGAYPNPQAYWKVEMQDASGNVADSFTVNGYTGGAWSQPISTTRSSINAMAQKIVIYGKRDGSSQAILDTGGQFTSNQPYIGNGSFVQPLSNVIDDNTATYMKTNAEANPSMTLDLGSGNDAIISQVALYPHSDLDETEIQIQTSPDNSTYTTRRTITVSGNITTGQWNLIRINSTYCRYIRVRGSSGSSKTLSFNEMKLKSVSDTEVTANHGHSEIGSTDTSLGLDGT